MNQRAANVAGGALLHPVVLASMVVLVINDHLLKHTHPSWLTGKLSDFAGLLFFPLLLQGFTELAERAVVGAHVPSRTVLGISVGLVGVVFTLTEITAWGPTLYVGALDWALGSGHQTWADPTDLLALPTLVLSYWLGRRRLERVGLSEAPIRTTV